jgi:heptosyltransferase-2
MIGLEKFVDRALGSLLVLVLLPFALLGRLFPARREPRRILILKLWAVGDAIVALPMARALRKRYPAARIDVLCRNRNRAVFQGQPDINGIFMLEPPLLAPFSFSAWNFRRYDLVIDTEPFLNLSALIGFLAGSRRIGFAGQFRSLLYTDTVEFRQDRHMVRTYLAMAALAGAKGAEALVPLATAAADDRAAQEFLRENGVRPGDFLVGLGIGVGESGKTRLWFNDRWAEFADRLIERKHAKVILIGGPADRALHAAVLTAMRNPAIDAAGRLTLPQSFALIRRCNAFTGCDTGQMHMAAAQGVPTVGLFGPNLPGLWAPFNKRSLPVYHPLPCSPCIRNELGRMPDCIRKTDRYLCMRRITVDEVSEAMQTCMKPSPA